MRSSGAAAFGSLWNSFGGSLPFVTVIALASAPPTKKPFSNACRMLRTSRRLLPEIAVSDLVVVPVEGADPTRVLTALERPEGGLGGEAPGLDRVVHALQPGEVDETGALAREQQPGRAEAAAASHASRRS